MRISVRTLATASALLVAALAMLARAHAQAPSASLDVKLGKSTFIHGEPIEIRVRFLNSGPLPSELIFRYPNLRYGIARGGFEVDAKEAGLTLVPEPQRADVVMERVIGFKVKSGEAFGTRVFLQRFVEQPPVGKHDLPFTLLMGYEMEGAPGVKHDVIAKGRLVFAVTPRDEDKLRKEFENYLAQAKGKTISRREAVEALSVIKDPIVIPFLTQLADTPPRQLAGLEALKPFKNSEAARLAVEDALNSADRLVVMSALDILTEWKHQLSIRQVKRLLDREDEPITRATVRYIQAMDQEKFRKLLPK